MAVVVNEHTCIEAVIRTIPGPRQRILQKYRTLMKPETDVAMSDTTKLEDFAVQFVASNPRQETIDIARALSQELYSCDPSEIPLPCVRWMFRSLARRVTTHKCKLFLSNLLRFLGFTNDRILELARKAAHSLGNYQADEFEDRIPSFKPWKKMAPPFSCDSVCGKPFGDKRKNGLVTSACPFSVADSVGCGDIEDIYPGFKGHYEAYVADGRENRSLHCSRLIAKSVKHMPGISVSKGIKDTPLSVYVTAHTIRYDSDDAKDTIMKT